jgi:hypothetical protein
LDLTPTPIHQAAPACHLPLRSQVAQVLVAALRQPAAANKVLEIVASPSSPVLPEDKWYSA